MLNFMANNLSCFCWVSERGVEIIHLFMQWRCWNVWNLPKFRSWMENIFNWRWKLIVELMEKIIFAMLQLESSSNSSFSKVKFNYLCINLYSAFGNTLCEAFLHSWANVELLKWRQLLAFQWIEWIQLKFPLEFTFV
jgi:hypothetical protein